MSEREIATELATSIWTVKRIRARDPSFPPALWITSQTPRFERARFHEWLAARQRGGHAPMWGARETKPLLKPRKRRA